MLKLHELMLLKEANNNDTVIHVAIAKREFVFKQISVRDYQNIKMLNLTQEEEDDAVCQCCLLYPEDYDFSNTGIGGVSTMLSGRILELSYINNNDAVLGMYKVHRDKIDTSFFDYVSLFIKAAFPEFSLNEIEQWNIDRIIKTAAKADFVMMIKGAKYSLTKNEEQNESEETAEEIKDISSIELREHGIDPMYYFRDKLVKDNNIIDFPFLSGNDWRKACGRK